MATSTYNYNDAAIGTGALFPIELSTNSSGETGWYPVSGDISLIENNLRALIEYNIGQRFRQEDFGTRLQEAIEEPNTQPLQFMINYFLKDALSKYEERLKLKQVETVKESYKLHITMLFTLVGLNKDASMSISYNTLTNDLN